MNGLSIQKPCFWKSGIQMQLMWGGTESLMRLLSSYRLDLKLHLKDWLPNVFTDLWQPQKALLSVGFNWKFPCQADLGIGMMTKHQLLSQRQEKLKEKGDRLTLNSKSKHFRWKPLLPYIVQSWNPCLISTTVNFLGLSWSMPRPSKTQSCLDIESSQHNG